ncbi:signal peptidase I [Dactylosporangium sp. NPDC000521]|uniref:signal peptidase I n=1 Tax=Dactylosporangium sp. NPDC000521 TaxID=3363975 RepID=UPI0036873D77
MAFTHPPRAGLTATASVPLPRILLCAALLLSGCTAADERAEYTMNTDAMQPKLSAGQSFKARRVRPGSYQPHAGDVVVFTPPPSWDRRGVSVARVVAVGEAEIACCDDQGRVTVDGITLDEPYLGENSSIDNPPDDRCVSRRFGPMPVGTGQVFLMGDSRGISMDSRCLGTVHSDRIVAVAE